MSLTQKQAARIIEEETSRFMDTSFGGLDLSSFPNLQSPPTETSLLDDRFSKPYSSFHGLDSSGLRAFLSTPDSEALADLATADPEMAERLQENVAEDVAGQFIKRHPDYLRTDQNFHKILDLMTNQHLRRDLDEFEDNDHAIRALVRVNAWTVGEITKAYRHLLREGSLLVPANQPRSLTDRELAHCAQLAANGDVTGAVCLFLQHRISEDVADDVSFSLMAPEAFTSDPKFRPYVEEALLFAWEHARLDYSPNESRRRFLRDHVCGRFMTIALLDAAWEACKEAEKDANRSALFRPTQTDDGQRDQANLDELSDEEINHLTKRTLRAHAEKVLKERHGFGVWA